MKKITSIVLNNFKNDSRVLKENVSLQKAGYDVQVVALHEEPLDELEQVQNISVHRIKLKTRGWSKHKLIQLIKYSEFMFKVIRKYKYTDIIHCNDLSALPIGFFIKKIFNKKVKVIYDAHEYETEINGLSGLKKTLMKWLEKRLIKCVDATITVSDSIANEYARLYDIKKPALVLNTPPYKSIQKQDKFREFFNISTQRKIFLYQGGLSKGRGIEIILDTFKSLYNEAEEESPVIVFMGYGPLEKLIKENTVHYQNIYFHQAVSPNALLDYTSSADFGISTIEDSCLSYRYCLPNKIFEYLMAEIPVIVSDLYEMKLLVINNEVGSVVRENTPNGLKITIKESIQLDKHLLQENIKQLKLVYNWEEQEKVLLSTYKGLYEK